MKRKINGLSIQKWDKNMGNLTRKKPVLVMHVEPNMNYKIASIDNEEKAKWLLDYLNGIDEIEVEE